ncbi:restriction endonuclease subunit S [Pseudomonadota bacterium 24LQ007]|jgi:type I restriction enzyme S subunit|uniref:restriction endonuclease subunit S n=1 Tax=Marinobacter sp. ST-43 TaxID=3050453 RepID=UPI0026DFFC29|nr:restriction endonuclease subunit S [Marinobacter sp. ST-43]MEC9038941.1 restriction endonuclease subunit S [Pseudomonadota bacterium]|tara:strand:- start:321 stop:1550 length:1230 start_codon:yes stop_codon:yes gene_type:complete
METHISKFAMVRLSEYAEIKPGFAFKSDRFTDKSSDIPLVKGDNVQQGYIDWTKAKFWNSDDVDDYRDYLLEPGDIVVAMDRPWVNAGLKWAFIKAHDPKCLLVQRVARLRAKRGLSQDFLRYLVSSKYFASYIEPIVTGVNVPHISGKQIGDFRIPLPEIDIQEKVAALLATYDDLIENNKRRITLLENMAEEIYREWFVRFRFPGWQEAEFEKGLPAGWSIKRLNDILVLQYGKALKSEDRVEGTVPVYGSSGVVGFHNEALVERPGIIVGRKGNVGAIHWSDVAFYPIDTVYYVVSDLSKHFLYYLLHSVNFINNDAAVPGLNRKQAYSNEVLVPKSGLIEQFEELVKPLYDQKRSLIKMNDNLEKTKNQLLPRLISGKLSVENLDIQFPPSMQSDESDSADEAAA